MEKITQNKLAVKIICVALSVILWLYVSYQENPSMSKTVRNVPLAISGEQALKESGFSIYSISEKSVDVKITAKRLTLARLSNRTVSAVINVSAIKDSGTYTIPATVSSSLTSNAAYYVKGKDIKIVVEPIKKNTYTVEADIAAAQDTSVVLSSHELSEKRVTVSAPESIIKEIASVKTEQIIPDKNGKEQVAKLLVYGKNGKVLEGAECTPAQVTVKYSFHDVKAVPVVLKTTGGKTIPLPAENTVKIYGSGYAFENANQIETEEINLAQFKEGSKVRIKLKLPKNVMLADSSNEIEIELLSEYYND